MTTYKRGDVILVKFPYSDLVRYKKRPALVVQDETVETGLSQEGRGSNNLQPGPHRRYQGAGQRR